MGSSLEQERKKELAAHFPEQNQLEILRDYCSSEQLAILEEGIQEGKELIYEELNEHINKNEYHIIAYLRDEKPDYRPFITDILSKSDKENKISFLDFVMTKTLPLEIANIFIKKGKLDRLMELISKFEYEAQEKIMTIAISTHNLSQEDIRNLQEERLLPPILH